MAPVNKSLLLQQVIGQLENSLATSVESALEAKAYSTSEESKAENKYDTRGLEASYLASGQAKRAKDLEEQIYNLKRVALRDFTSEDPISVGACIQVLRNPDQEKWFFILPVGGVEIEHNDISIQSLTLESPLGQTFYNCLQGDEVELSGKVYEILKVF